MDPNKGKIINNMALKEVQTKDNKEIKKLKEYKTPKLITYGDISELVLANGGVGTDGSGFPPFSLT